jgi:single-strand DNA-binding protein
MRTVNTVTLLGNVAREPMARNTTGGKVFSTFVIATNREWGAGEEIKSIPEFHNIVAWGKLSEIAEKFCTKGRLVYIEGYLKTRSWDHDSGAKIFRTEIVATNIIALNRSTTRAEEEGEDESFGHSFSSEMADIDDYFQTPPDNEGVNGR